jgi:outer membrane protein OmpA-like peptidoglycan-associated protein
MPRTTLTTAWTAALVLIGSALMSAPGFAQDPAVKDLLGKAQSQSETKAVEDLITKLKRQQAKPTVPSTKEEPAAAGSGTQTKPPEPTAKPSTPATPEAAATKDTGATAGTSTSTSTAVSTAVEQMPSVDLEVLFEYNSARIAPAALATLTTLGRALTDARLAGDSFLIAGHTDAKGGADYNLRLSQQRAGSVRDFLVREFNIDAKRLVAKGFGQRQLKDSQNPLDAKNRRVQIVNFTPPQR